MMSNQLFTQTVIAVVWDFDKTLIPGYMPPDKLKSRLEAIEADLALVSP